MSSKLYILAGGGSGGHLYPGIAVARALQQLRPSVRVLFLCTKRDIDATILDAEGYTYHPQPIRPLPSPKRPWQAMGFYRSWRASMRQCKSLVAQERPVAVLGLGGFASAPALKVAAKQGIPNAMLNPDAVPGKANQYLARFADTIFLQFEATRPFFGEFTTKCRITGCPIRPELVQQDRPAALRELGLDSGKKTLAIMGGSLGGHNVNAAVVRWLTGEQKSLLPADWQIIHLTGVTDEAWVKKEYETVGINAKVLAFTPRMERVLAAADLVIGRAGAVTLAELTAVGVPSILLPYPYHRDRHQEKNAKVLADAGAARIVTDTCNDEKTAVHLITDLSTLLHNDDELSRMKQNARFLGRRDAAQTIAAFLDGHKH
ncbi:MAG: UDP-N-acetylglucosamine--N-acetylmuramyl-(pentapeptide) pyrophosphoryl-undecaprenol N-acetylglucosamine transferase [Sedimentisphaerales bacterium]|nr:UDP-N-acetylglucosamine--N-acetylmuramyl-(pentapeptide) pyrophosphoryl-undecaprenol N-acetylglucosamine transferase [Sedimentisphaerales bacterium]